MSVAAHIPAYVDQASRGAHIKRMVQKMVAARGPVPRAELAEGALDSWLPRCLGALRRSGVLARSYNTTDKGGQTTAYAIENWHVAEKIVDTADPAELYVRWVANPPTRKLPAAHIRPAPVPTVAPLPASPVASLATASSRLLQIADAIAVLRAEGLL